MMLVFIEQEDPELAHLLREFIQHPSCLDKLRVKRLVDELIQELIAHAIPRAA